jgi:hypothetical protein
MIRFQSTQLNRACRHLLHCRKSAPAWAMVIVWRITTRLILALACPCKVYPKGLALMLCLALIVTRSFRAIKRRGRQEGEIWICHAMILVFPDNFSGMDQLGAVTSNVHNCAAMELLQIRQAGPVWVAQSSCWWQAQDQGAFCKGKPDMNLNLQYAKLQAWRRIRGDSEIIMRKCARILFAFSSIADNHTFIYSGMMCVYCCHVTSGYTLWDTYIVCDFVILEIIIIAPLCLVWCSY